MPRAKQKLFLEAFNEFPDYHFIWKFESNISSADLPKNLQIHPWLPLSDILADSKVKAIFFHGGLLTTQEALYRAVPMLIMPFGFDQNQVNQISSFTFVFEIDVFISVFFFLAEFNQMQTSWNG